MFMYIYLHTYIWGGGGGLLQLPHHTCIVAHVTYSYSYIGNALDIELTRDQNILGLIPVQYTLKKLKNILNNILH